MKGSSLRAGLCFGSSLLLAACGDRRAADIEGGPTNVSPAGALVESPAAAQALRASTASVGNVLDVPRVIERFEREGGRVRAMVLRAARAAVPKTASVELPAVASGDTLLRDDLSGVSVRFALEGARPAPIAIASGFALYDNAFDGARLVHHVHAEGTEDWVFFAKKPASETLVYTVDVSQVPGLRLVSDTLEFLDETGSPALRVAPPFVVGPDGRRQPATLAVRGCAYDTNPIAPFGRAITPPGAKHCTVVVAWSSAVYPLAVDPAWVATGSLAGPRSSHTATLLGSGKVLVAGGAGTSTTCLTTAEIYDPAASGGVGAFAATGSMTGKRNIHTATVLGSGKVLVTGGSDCTSAISTAEVYDPGTGSFTNTASLSTVRQSHTATLISTGKVVVIGGITNSGTRLSTAELFDPAGTGSFSATGSMATGRQVQTATLLVSGKVLVAGGNIAGSYVSTAELYDPIAGTFAGTGSMAAPRASHSSVRLSSGKVLVAGGFTFAGHLSTAEIYDPAGTGSWTATGNMPTGRASDLLLLPTGLVLAAGGSDASGPLATSLLFDPAGGGGVGAFSATTPMGTPRYAHGVTLLPSGRVLATAGVVAPSTLTSSAEVFTAATKTNGTTCGTATECVSGICVDGVCCESTCTGPCDACDVAGSLGKCAHVSGTPRGGRTCAGTAPCNGSCSGSTSTCTYPTTSTTCGTTCITGGEATSTCNGAGACTPGTTAKSCGSYACVGTACKTACGTEADCAAGYTCAAPNCVPVDGGVDGGVDAPVGDSGADSSGADTGTTDTSVAADTSVADTSSSSTCTTPGAACGDGLTCTTDLRCVPGVPTQKGCACSVPTQRDDGRAPAMVLGLGALSILVLRRRRESHRR